MAVFIPDIMDRYDPDALRYYLCAIMPETDDSDFTWKDFVARNNNELVATWGNLAHRALTFTYRNFDGRVPDPGELDDRSKQLLAKVDTMVEDAGRELSACHFRAALAAAMSLAQETNRFLDETAPWKAIKENRAAAGRSLYTVLNAINGINIALSPFLPFSCERLQTYLGFDTPLIEGGWQANEVPAGQALREPQPLFTKLEPEIAAEEEGRLAS
jgi:methionyl-tRNA synthetase